MTWIQSRFTSTDQCLLIYFIFEAIIYADYICRKAANYYLNQKEFNENKKYKDV